MIRRTHHARILWVVVLAAALAGAWVCGTLLVEHDGGWHVGRDDTGYLLRLCESQIVPSASCADVVGSRWGSFDVYIGSRRVYVPTSLIGIAYFVSIAVWFAILGCIPATARRLWQLTLLVVSCGLAGSIFFTALMALTLSQWCPLCVIAHVLNAGVFIGTVWLWRNVGRVGAHEATISTSDAPAIGRIHGRLAGWAVVAAGAACVGLWFYFDAMTEVRRQWRKLQELNQVVAAMQNDRGFVLREYFAQPVVDLPRRPRDDHVAPPDARESAPTLVVFTDYDSSACACIESRRRAIIENPFAGRLRIDYRHFPGELIDPASNRNNGAARANRSAAVVRNGPYAGLAAEAARLQGGESAFSAMHRLLFEHRKDHPHPGYARLARRAGLDAKRLLADMNSDIVRRRIQEDVALATGAGASTAPALFLKGRRVPDLCVASRVFWEAVAEALPQGPVRTAAGTEVVSR